MPGKNTADVIQSLLEKNKGFMTVTGLASSISLDVKRGLGIRKGDSGKVIRRKIEQSAGDRFMFHAKGNSVYILEPCEPSEFVLGLLSENRAFDTKSITSLPFTKAEFVALVNELADDGRVLIKLTDDMKPKIYRAGGRVKAVREAGIDDGEYTTERFREAFEESDKGRTFVRIFRMRRYLGWPREVFDSMVRTLRDNEVIYVHSADPTILKGDDLSDGFLDEYGIMNGTVTWNE
ncbi:MAG: hypothetical protein IJP86_08445 [Synergistaceae bacterium]|nr:hypothetical protein [Synergistaceae bacterium]